MSPKDTCSSEKNTTNRQVSHLRKGVLTLWKTTSQFSSQSRRQGDECARSHRMSVSDVGADCFGGKENKNKIKTEPNS